MRVHIPVFLRGTLKAGATPSGRSGDHLIKIGLALGGGGAKGLAHIPLLEVFDEMGIRPHRIAGTSMGAIIGAAYASGNSARNIRKKVDDMLISRGDRLRDIFNKRDLRKWIEFLDPHFGRGGLVKGGSFKAFLADGLVAPTFADLEIPLKIVAADYWTREQIILDTGDLPTAIRASMAVPGVIAPIKRNDLVLIDGGLVNPVPYDLWEDCDLTVAIDVTGSRSTGKKPIPGVIDSVFNAFQIMQLSIVNEKISRTPPDILIRPDITGVRIFELYKARTIYNQSRAAQDLLRQELKRAIG